MKKGKKFFTLAGLGSILSFSSKKEASTTDDAKKKAPKSSAKKSRKRSSQGVPVEALRIAAHI